MQTLELIDILRITVRANARFCKPKVAGSNPAPGTNKSAEFRDKSRTQAAQMARTKAVQPVTKAGTADYTNVRRA